MGSDREFLSSGSGSPRSYSFNGSRIHSRNKPFLKCTLATFFIVPVVVIIFNFLFFRTSYGDDIILTDNHIADWDAEDPRLIQHIQKHYLYQPSPRSEPYNLLFPNKRDWSHKKQSMVVDEILGGKKSGVFFEAGAYDGETYSNSLYFEKYLNWTGVLVEPDEANIRRFLSKNRKAYLVKGCLAGKSKPQIMTFFGAMDVGTLSDKDLTPIKRWLSKLWRPVRETQVWCFPLISVLKAVNMTKIDYMVLDIEGAEMPVLENTPWDQVDVSVYQIEYAVFQGAYWDKDKSHRRLDIVRRFMRKQFPGFDEYARIFLDLIYAKHGMTRPKETLDNGI